MDGENHGGVLQARRQGEGARDGDQPHVRQAHRLGGKESGKPYPCVAMDSSTTGQMVAAVHAEAAC